MATWLYRIGEAVALSEKMNEKIQHERESAATDSGSKLGSE